ncbi:putative Ig domain-containing protein, partial [Limnohabitans sp.]
TSSDGSATGNATYTVNLTGVIDAPTAPVSAPLTAAPTVIVLVQPAPVETVKAPASSFISSGTTTAEPMLSSDPASVAYTPVATTPEPLAQTSSAVVSLGVSSNSGSGISGLRAIEATRDVVAAPGERVNYTLPAGTFEHTDGAASVSLSARLADGRPLPSYVKFNPTTGTITVEVDSAEKVEEIQVMVNAVDDKGQSASTKVVIKLKEKASNSSAIDLQIKLGKPALSEQIRMTGKPAGALAELAALSKAFSASNSERNRA